MSQFVCHSITVHATDETYGKLRHGKDRYALDTISIETGSPGKSTKVYCYVPHNKTSNSFYP